MWVKKSCGYAGHYSKPKSQQSTTKHIVLSAQYINNWRAHESPMNCYSNYNKAKLKKHMHILWDVLRQQRKTTCLLSIRITFACARVSKLTTTSIYIARARCENQLAVGSSGLNPRSITPKFVTPTAPSCIDNSWRSTTLPTADSASSNQTLPFQNE